MNCLFVLCILCALPSYFVAAKEIPQIPLYDIQLNFIDDLVKDGLEYIRKLFKKYEPFDVPNLPPINVYNKKDPNVNLTIQLTNVKVSNATDFKINYIDNSLIHLKANFGVTVPKLKLEGKYIVNGQAENKKVKGKGSFKLNIGNLVTNGEVDITVGWTSVKMSTMNINYTINKINFEETGLSVEGLTEKELKNLFNSAILDFFRQKEKWVSAQVSEFVKKEANELMTGKSIENLLEWLKNVIMS